MRVSVEVTPGACIALAVLMLTIPLPWLLSAILAAGFHEFCHMAAIRLQRGQIYSLRIGVDGAKLHTAPLSPSQEMLCALAGPCGSLLLAGLGRWLPGIAFCGFVQGLFNLIPIYPLDGGRICRCILEWIPLVKRKIPCKEAKVKVQ